jgi:integrase
VSKAVEAYLQRLRDRDRAPATVESAEDRLRLMLASVWNKPVRRVSAQAQALYDAAQVHRAADTHRNALSVTRAWAAFCVKRKWLKSNPFAGIEPTGRKRRGAEKSQLRVTESARILEVCLGQGPEGIAAALALLLGLRASEVASIQARDVDAGGTLLWIPKSKSDAGRRRLRIPEVLRDRLVALADNRVGPIFFTALGKPATRYWVTYQVKRLCGLARVPVVTSQALRRTHATLATEAGATGDLVAAQLGHTSSAITHRAYIEPSAASDRAARIVGTSVGTTPASG